MLPTYHISTSLSSFGAHLNVYWFFTFASLFLLPTYTASICLAICLSNHKHIPSLSLYLYL